MAIIFDADMAMGILGFNAPTPEEHRQAVGKLALERATLAQEPMAVWKDATSSMLCWGPIEPETERWTILDIAYPEGFIAQVQA